MSQIDESVKSKMAQYLEMANELTALDRRKHKSNLLSRDLADLLGGVQLMHTEYLESLLVVVPSTRRREWFQSYEAGIISEGVLPRSSELLIEEDDYALVTVTLMRKFRDAFIKAAASHRFELPTCTANQLFAIRFVCRTDCHQLNDQEAKGEKERERKLHEESDSAWNAVMRLIRTNFGEIFSIWVHIKVLRCFVESVLRYGLPAHFLFFTMKPALKSDKRTRIALLQFLQTMQLDGISPTKVQEALVHDFGADDLADLAPEELEIMRSHSASSLDPYYDVFVKTNLYFSVDSIKY
jgi:V-type H+-transporting ATPase subunit C